MNHAQRIQRLMLAAIGQPRLSSLDRRSIQLADGHEPRPSGRRKFIQPYIILSERVHALLFHRGSQLINFLWLGRN